MGFIKEFKEFAVKGNAMDLAVGVIIGGAFGKLVSSLVNDILLPPISALAGNTDLSQLKVDLSAIRSTVSKAGESAPPKEEQLLTEIRDLLKARNGEHE